MSRAVGFTVLAGKTFPGDEWHSPAYISETFASLDDALVDFGRTYGYAWRDIEYFNGRATWSLDARPTAGDFA